MGKLAKQSNVNNLVMRDVDDGFFDIENETGNQIKNDVIAEAIELSENAKNVLQKMTSNVAMTGEELYNFYLELTTLTEEYPEITSDKTY